MATDKINLAEFYNKLKNSALFYTHQFQVYFVDGGDDTTGDSGDLFNTKDKDKAFKLFVQSASVPQVDIKENTVSFLSQKFIVPGNVQFNGTWNVKVLLQNNMDIYFALYNWQEKFASLQNNGAGSKSIPNVNAVVELLDSSMSDPIRKFVLVGVFPSNIPDLSMQYENQATVVDFNATFTYQYVTELDKNNGPVDKNDMMGTAIQGLR